MLQGEFYEYRNSYPALVDRGEFQRGYNVWSSGRSLKWWGSVS